MFETGFNEYISGLKGPSEALSGAIFAYEMSIKICEQVSVESESEGQTYYISLINFFLDFVLGCIQQYRHSELSTKLRVVELKQFIFTDFIQDLLITIVRSCGEEVLIPVPSAHCSSSRRSWCSSASKRCRTCCASPTKTKCARPACSRASSRTTSRRFGASSAER
jgi:hypothetical protein